jgi:hypothetical protein
MKISVLACSTLAKDNAWYQAIGQCMEEFFGLRDCLIPEAQLPT